MSRWALWLVAAAAFGTLAYLAMVPPRRPRRRRDNPWRTLSNRRRVFLDDEGRIEKGGPTAWRGADVRDLPELGRRWRGIERDEAACATGGRLRSTFSTSEEAVRALLDANPHLEDFVELEAKGGKERAYLEWLRGGRRGPKPQLGAGDGRFDVINQTLDLKGRRRVATWREALRKVVPPSRRWADFGERLELLEEATGLQLNLPAPAEELDNQESGRAECFAAGDRYRDDLVDRARRGRLGGEDLAEVPF